MPLKANAWQAPRTGVEKNMGTTHPCSETKNRVLCARAMKFENRQTLYVGCGGVGCASAVLGCMGRVVARWVGSFSASMWGGVGIGGGGMACVLAVWTAFWRSIGLGICCGGAASHWQWWAGVGTGMGGAGWGLEVVTWGVMAVVGCGGDWQCWGGLGIVSGGVGCDLTVVGWAG